MPTVRIEAQLSAEELIEAVEQLESAELEEFTQRVLALRAKRKAPALPQGEADLLLKINQGPPPALQQRYTELIAKRRAETLAPDEYAELLRLTEQMEGFDAQRMEHLAQLASLRQTSISQLMKDLGITPPPYA